MPGISDLIYSPSRDRKEAISKVESHTPKIDAPGKVKAGEKVRFQVTVSSHPNTVEHSIQWIETYFEEEGRSFNPVLLARFEATPSYTEPIIEITVKLNKSGTMHALEYCNLHGLWENSRKIVVE
ncbi:MAG: desulfoferrodoxin [Thermoprotei archaeon]|nr:MAG: desulfoferrodoxin [Thermoprotei archaeon]